jgi:hypothetical protein
VSVPNQLTSASELPSIPSLPDPFRHRSGQRLQSRAEWPRRRAELSALVQHYGYGPYPPPEAQVRGALARDRSSLEITIRVAGAQASFRAEVSLPSGRGPFPAFVLINPTALAAERLLQQGIARIVFDAREIAVDRKREAADQAPRAERQGLLYDLYGPHIGTGALMAWGWAVHRIIDALQDVPEIDAQRVAVNGFSRFGKAAVLAGAFDERIVLTVPSSSGQAGVGNFRSADGLAGVQTIQQIVEEAPQWFGDRFAAGFGRTTPAPAQRLPFDAHSVLALIAPRGLLATEGGEDRWNHPPGPALSRQAARSVYEYLGVADRIGLCHVAGAGHQLVEEQQRTILRFAERFLLDGSPSPPRFDEPYGPAPEALVPWRAPV